MKAIAFILILIITTGTGLYKTFTLRKRGLEIRRLLDMVDKVRMEIRYMKKPSRELFAGMKELVSLPLTDKLSCMSDENIHKAYQNAKKDVLFSMHIKKEDWEILDSFFRDFGKTSLENQLSLCDNTYEQLKKNSEDAACIYNKYARLYSLSGLLAGLFIVIVLA